MKFSFIKIAALFFALSILGCQDDKAREQATAQALENTSTTAAPPANSEPAAAPSQPATVGSLPLSISSKTASQGGEACVAVTARNFNQIVSMQYSMKWDKNVLKFKGLKGFSLPGLGPENFGKNQAAEGILTYSWYDANVQGISRPDNTSLYEVCFEVVGGTGARSTVEFANSPTIIEIANVNSQFYELAGQNGTVQVQ